MKTFMVERYVPGMSQAELAKATHRLEAAVAELAGEGVPVVYRGSTFVPEEESCFCRFDALSIESVREANTRAAFAFARILEAEVVAEPRPTAEKPAAARAASRRVASSRGRSKP